MTEAPQPYQRKWFQFQTFSILVCSVHVSILLYEFDFSDRFTEIHQTLNFSSNTAIFTCFCGRDIKGKQNMCRNMLNYDNVGRETAWALVRRNNSNNSLRWESAPFKQKEIKEKKGASCTSSIIAQMQNRK